MRKYLTVEVPDNPVVVDFLGQYPCVAILTMDDKGELWVKVVSATQEVKILVDEVVSVPKGKKYYLEWVKWLMGVLE